MKLKNTILEAEKTSLKQLQDWVYHKKNWLLVGDPTFASALHDVHAGPLFTIDDHPPSPNAQPETNLVAHWNKLPLPENSTEACFLPHVLERSPRPHDVLKEVHRILKPEGLLLISHFNPYSLWGGYHFYQKLSKLSRHVNFLSKSRMLDWLQLLDLNVICSQNFLWRPPLPSSFLQDHLKMIDDWHWLSLAPFLGGAYWILAQKKLLPLTPVKPSWFPSKAEAQINFSNA